VLRCLEVQSNVGENGEYWVPADMVRYSDPIIPLVLWPLAILGTLMFVLVIGSIWAKMASAEH
jgi:hypothetical protein